MVIMPEFTIIVPYYFKAEYLHRLLSSLLSQTFTNFECLIIDDGSDLQASNLYELITEDKRFTCIRKENEGVAATRNLGIDLCKGNYIIFLDADDALNMHTLDNVSKSFLKFDVDVVHYKTQIVENGVLRPWAFRWKLYRSSFKDILKNWDIDLIVPIHSCAYKREFIERNDLKFDSSLVNKEDWDFLLKAFACKPTTINLGFVGADYHVGKKVQRSRDKFTLYEGAKEVLKRWGALYPNEAQYNLIYRRMANNGFSIGYFANQPLEISSVFSIFFKKIGNRLRCILY